MHHDQDPVFTGYGWTYPLLIRDQVRLSYTPNGARDNPVMEAFDSRFKTENRSLLVDAETLTQLQEVVAAIEKLRPAEAEPRELPSREWYAYLILREAYIHDESNREIMPRLYVSEATFHHTRRSAPHAVARALFEMDFPAHLQN